MFYTVYRVINLHNDKEYIGKHQTQDLEDGYMGSGKLLKKAIRKHGLENFKKEILHIFKTEEEMNSKEAELVTEEYCRSSNSYNICPGGNGGWGYVNNIDVEGRIIKNKKAREIADSRGASKKALEKIEWLRKHDEDWVVSWKKKQSEVKKGKNTGEQNPAFGKIWITNGKENKMIKKDLDNIPEGWYRGKLNKRRG